jgi:hypothetical protein
MFGAEMRLCFCGAGTDNIFQFQEQSAGKALIRIATVILPNNNESICRLVTVIAGKVQVKVNLSLCLTKYLAMKTYEEVVVFEDVSKSFRTESIRNK